MFLIYPWKEPWNTLETTFTLPWNYLETSFNLEIALKHPWNAFEMLFNSPWNFLETTLKLPWNTLKTLIRYPWNILEIPLKQILTPIKYLCHSLMSFDIPNVLHTSKTLKKKRLLANERTEWQCYFLGWLSQLQIKLANLVQQMYTNLNKWSSQTFENYPNLTKQIAN